MTIKLPSGRELDPNDDYVGLSNDLRVGDGFDSCVYLARIDAEDLLEMGIYEPEDIWSVEDKIALADIMIERWQRYRQSAFAGKVIERSQKSNPIDDTPAQALIALTRLADVP